MTNSEKKALEAYPDHLFPTPGNGLVGPKDYEREIYIEGYEQAERDLKKELLDWINDKCEKHSSFKTEELAITFDKLKEKIESL